MGTHTVLMYFVEIDLTECTQRCRQHLRCNSVNYGFVQRICELVEMDFDESESDGPDDPEWINLGTASISKVFFVAHYVLFLVSTNRGMIWLTLSDWFRNSIEMG